MDSRQRNSLVDKIFTVATTLTMWWSESFGRSGTTLSTAALKFILAIYPFLAVILVYLFFVPMHSSVKFVMMVPWLAFVGYFGYLKVRNLYKKPLWHQLRVHAQIWIVWTHVLAITRHWYQPSYHHFFTITLFDVVIPFGGTTKGTCRGQMYGVLWYYGLMACFLTHLVHLYWTLTRKVQMVPTVKKYHMLPPAPKIKK